MLHIKIFISLLLVIIVLSCSDISNPDELENSLLLNDTTYIAIHETKWNYDKNIGVKYRKQLEESRCPIGVHCFWEGNAKVELEVRVNNLNHIIHLNTYNGYTRDTLLNNFRINLINVFPYPRFDSAHVSEDRGITIFVSEEK
ncbi:MAG: hypothetical protein ABFS12_01790 [Bacteroidota bacterium]